MNMHNPQPTHAEMTIPSHSCPSPKESSSSISLPEDTSGVSFFHNLEEGLPVEEVHRRALEARKCLAHAQRALSFYLVDMEKRALYRHFGCSSVFQYGELYLELAPHTIAEYLRSGKEMATLPLLAAACEKGEISPSKIREISRVAVPEPEEAWLSIARNSTYRQIEKLVPLTPRGGLPPAASMKTPAAAGISHSSAAVMNHNPEKSTGENGVYAPRQAALPDSGGNTMQEGEAKEPQDPRLSWRPDVEPVQGAGPLRYHTKLVLELEHDRLAIITRALEKARQESGEKERGALLEYIARAFLEKSPSGGGESVPYRVTIHHLPESGVAWTEAGGGPGSSSGPRYVQASTLEEALCDAEILDLGEPGGIFPRNPVDSPPFGLPGPCVEDPNGEKRPVMDVHTPPLQSLEEGRHGPRLRRTIPLTLRRQVLERDERRCTAPGCGHGNYLALHHIISVAAGGKDHAQNITTTCFRCHRALHRNMLFVEGDAPGALVWKNRYGEVIKGGAPRERYAAHPFPHH